MHVRPVPNFCERDGTLVPCKDSFRELQGPHIAGSSWTEPPLRHPQSDFHDLKRVWIHSSIWSWADSCHIQIHESPSLTTPALLPDAVDQQADSKIGCMSGSMSTLHPRNSAFTFAEHPKTQYWNEARTTNCVNTEALRIHLLCDSCCASK